MQASSLLRKFLTMSFSVAIMAGRFRLVRSEVSIRIPSETASEGGAITLGRFGGVEATGSGAGGPRNVSSKPMVTFLLWLERASAAVVVPEASFRALRVACAGALVREFPFDGAERFEATTAFEGGIGLPV